MNPLEIAYICAVALCLADIGDRWRWARHLRRCGINPRLTRPRALDWLLALFPPAYALRRWFIWR